MNEAGSMNASIGQSFSLILSKHASQFAAIALENIQRAYPNYPGHVICSAGSLVPHQSLHPAFYGSYDWHSSVHMHWLLARLLRLFPEMSEAARICHVFGLHLTETNIASEVAYFNEPAYRSFERTYGWAWLLKLQTELLTGKDAYPHMAQWGENLQPLADKIVERYLDFLPQAQFPIRAGTHGNSAFGLSFALEYARLTQHDDLEKIIAAKAIQWFGHDRDYPASYEPGGDDFLSGGLMEAALLQRILNQLDFANWWKGFSPAAQAPQAWLAPVPVSDRSDPKLSHLDGLNLSRAWCWQILLPAMPDAVLPVIHRAVDVHLAESLPHALSGHYAGTHWLASFALLALSPG